jgi:hypothetical protein
LLLTVECLSRATETRLHSLRLAMHHDVVSQYIYIYIYIYIYSPRRNVPDFERVFLMLKYNDITKYLCPKLNGYGNNGQREVCSSGGSTQCTWRLKSLITLSHKLHMCFLQGTMRCAVSHVTSLLASRVFCIVHGTLKTTMKWRATFFFVLQHNGFI